jgi:hypothetical protein
MIDSAQMNKNAKEFKSLQDDSYHPRTEPHFESWIFVGRDQWHEESHQREQQWSFPCRKCGNNDWKVSESPGGIVAQTTSGNHHNTHRKVWKKMLRVRARNWMEEQMRFHLKNLPRVSQRKVLHDAYETV